MVYLLQKLFLFFIIIYISHSFCRIQAELIKNESVEVDIETISKITAQDFEDACTEELSKFKFADIETGKVIYLSILCVQV